MLVPDGDSHVRAHVKVAVSPQFYGWVTAIGPGMEIFSPTDVRKEYTEYLSQIVSGYALCGHTRKDDWGAEREQGDPSRMKGM